tara:strand:+ start:759 stop:968 length:210 start_codon:yes stop_codon:yes gene_type:complete
MQLCGSPGQPGGGAGGGGEGGKGGMCGVNRPIECCSVLSTVSPSPQGRAGAMAAAEAGRGEGRYATPQM